MNDSIIKFDFITHEIIEQMLNINKNIIIIKLRQYYLPSHINNFVLF